MVCSGRTVHLEDAHSYCAQSGAASRFSVTFTATCNPAAVLGRVARHERPLHGMSPCVLSELRLSAVCKWASRSRMPVPCGHTERRLGCVLAGSMSGTNPAAAWSSQRVAARRWWQRWSGRRSVQEGMHRGCALEKIECSPIDRQTDRQTDMGPGGMRASVHRSHARSARTCRARGSGSPIERLDRRVRTCLARGIGSPIGWMLE
jgi:hypothetical protein